MSEQRPREAGVPWAGLPEAAGSMSNCFGTIDPGLEGELRAGKGAFHYAWEFCGHVWYDREAGEFREEVLRYHVSQGTRSAPALEQLMARVNDEFGWG